MNVQTLLQSTTIRSRVSFVLVVADRLTRSVLADSDRFQAAKNAIDDGWRWEEVGDIRANDLYDSHAPKLMGLTSINCDSDVSHATLAVAAAFLYTAWHAFRRELEVYGEDAIEVPNDMAEVTEELLEYVCAESVESNAMNRAGLNSLAFWFTEQYPADSTDDLGGSIPHEYPLAFAERLWLRMPH